MGAGGAAFVAGPSPMAAVTVADNVSHVIDVVRRVRRHGPVVLVGHSLGGVTIGLVGNAIPDEIEAATWGRIPRSFIRLTRDNVISPALATKMIEDADRLTPDNPFEVHSVAAGHVGVVFRARELAAILDGLV